VDSVSSVVKYFCHGGAEILRFTQDDNIDYTFIVIPRFIRGIQKKRVFNYRAKREINRGVIALSISALSVVIFFNHQDTKARSFIFLVPWWFIFLDCFVTMFLAMTILVLNL
jgi:hypothetical protein